MRRTTPCYWFFAALAFLTVASLTPGVVWACEGQAGRGPFDITGQILDDQGAPVSGLRLAWLPLIPGGVEPDLENVYYSIQGREIIETSTGPDGTFSLAGVVDFFDVKSHQYIVWNQDLTAEKPANPYIRLSDNLVDLSRTPPNAIFVDPVARPAGALLIRATTSDGAPYQGTLPLYFQSEGDNQEPPWELARACLFVNGEYLQGGLKPGATNISVLKGSSVEEIKFRNYLATYKSGDASFVAPVLPGDLLLTVATQVVAGETRVVPLTIPNR